MLSTYYWCFGERRKLTSEHPAVKQYVEECKEKFGEDPYLGGLEDLTIFECDDHVVVRIEEYDGAERVVTGYSDFF